MCIRDRADIAAIFEVTQAAISYRIDRAIYRIKFMLAIPEVLEEDMRRDLSLIFPEIDVNILVEMWKTTCQSEVAKILHLTQGRVRHRFFNAVKKLDTVAKEDDRYKPYHKIFIKIASRGFNSLRSVALPQWGKRGLDKVG